MKVCTILSKLLLTGLILTTLCGCGSAQKQRANQVSLDQVVKEKALEEVSFNDGTTMRVATFSGSYTRAQIQEFFEEWKRQHPEYEIMGDPQVIHQRHGIFRIPYLEVVFKKRQPLEPNSLQTNR